MHGLRSAPHLEFVPPSQDMSDGLLQGSFVMTEDPLFGFGKIARFTTRV